MKKEAATAQEALASDVLKMTGGIYYFSKVLQSTLAQPELDNLVVGMQTVSRAILQGNRLSFDYDANDDYYGGLVKGFVYKDDRVLGKAHYTDSALPDEQIEGFIYRSKAGILLYGRWWEGEVAGSFLADLKQVKGFNSETNK